MAAIVASRLTGTRPGILAMFIEDTDRAEWRGLRERLELEGEARQFLTNPAARSVVAVSCSSRLELFGLKEPDAAPEGELRFRNPAHPAAKAPALAPAVLAGSWLSRHVHARINGPALRLAVLIFSIVSGAALVLKG